MIYSTAFAAGAALGSIRGALLASPSGATNKVRSPLPSLDLRALRPYGETLGGALIAFAGIAFWLWPAP